MFVFPVGTYTPVAPIAPVERITRRRAKRADKSAGDRFAATRPARSADAIASHSTRAALDEMKLGG